MQTFRVPPVLTVSKSAAYALYQLTYIRAPHLFYAAAFDSHILSLIDSCKPIQDVAYKPEEYHVQTRKCEPDADAKVVQICERQITY